MDSVWTCVLQVALVITVLYGITGSNARSLNINEKNGTVDSNDDGSHTGKETVLRRKRAMAVKSKIGRQHWPGGVVHYAIDPNEFTPEERDTILIAMQEFEDHTCVKFQQTYSADMVKFEDGLGCHAMLGMIGGSQIVGLGKLCRTSKYAVMHALGHVLGLINEHRRPDRDQYIKINEENIPDNRQGMFSKFPVTGMQNFGRYDYQSIMQIPGTAWSKNGKPTMEAKDSSVPLGQPIQEPHLTFEDIKALNLMYPCDSKCPSLKSATCPEKIVGNDCHCWCKNDQPGKPFKRCGS